MPATIQPVRLKQKDKMDTHRDCIGRCEHEAGCVALSTAAPEILAATCEALQWAGSLAPEWPRRHPAVRRIEMPRAIPRVRQRTHLRRERVQGRQLHRW